MNTIMIYMSTHHQNTKKLVDVISEKYHIKTVPISEAQSIDLNSYDMIGFASGIAFGKFYEPLERFAKERLPHGKKRLEIVGYENPCHAIVEALAKKLEELLANRRIFCPANGGQLSC